MCPFIWTVTDWPLLVVPNTLPQVRFKLLTAITVKIIVFCHVTYIGTNVSQQTAATILLWLRLASVLVLHSPYDSPFHPRGSQLHLEDGASK
jgi:hypothetical protein